MGYTIKEKLEAVDLSRQIGAAKAAKEKNVGISSIFRWKRDPDLTKKIHITESMFIGGDYKNMSDMELRAILKIKRDLLNSCIAAKENLKEQKQQEATR